MRRHLTPLLFVALLAGAACGGADPNLPAAGSVEADKYLFDRGTAALQDRDWIEAREYFRQLVDTYPQSQYRQEAKLGIGDSYLGQNNYEANVLAVNEFQEFLSFFPGHPRTDYAQYKVALAWANQMLGPRRDPTPAQATLTETEIFLQNYPNSDLRPHVLELRRRALDDISGHDYNVGLYYFRIEWYPGAIERFKAILEQDPEYPQRDAVYFYLGEIYHASDQTAEALPYFDRLVTEFEESDYLERARRRIAEINAATQQTSDGT
jgi:outer membrane protein assembly factor BamD